jgi:hypothetical protein
VYLTSSGQYNNLVDASKVSRTASPLARLVDRVLSVSREEMLRREADYRKQVDANPNRRGPKRKIKASASHDPA